MPPLLDNDLKRDGWRGDFYAPDATLESADARTRNFVPFRSGQLPEFGDWRAARKGRVRSRRENIWICLITWTLVTLCVCASHAAESKPATRQLRSAWYMMPPFLFEEVRGDVTVLTGLDVSVLRAVAHEAGYRLAFEEVPWAEQLGQEGASRMDVAAAAAVTPRTSPHFRFSQPYRKAQNVLYMRVGEQGRIQTTTITEFIASVRKTGFRLAAHRGFTYVSPELDAFLADLANRYVTFADRDADNLMALARGNVDGVLIDRLAGATLALELGLSADVVEHSLRLPPVDIHVALSNRTTTEADLVAFDRAIDRLRDRGELQRILLEYLLPPMLHVTIGGRWFFYLDLLGTVAFAVSGIVLARKERYSAFGALVLSFLPAVGGGIVRDVVTDRSPIGVLRSPVYVVAVILVVAAGAVVFRVLDRRAAKHSVSDRRTASNVRRRLDFLLQVCDSIGLAAFTVIGVAVALETRSTPLWLWGPLLGAVTAAGGGVLRDVVRADFHSNTLKRGFYAEVALAWGLLFSLFLGWEVGRLQLEEVFVGTVVTLVGALATRLFIVFRGIENPLPLGSPWTAPEAVYRRLVGRTTDLWRSLQCYFEEIDGRTRPQPLDAVEEMHTRSLAQQSGLIAAFEEATTLPQPTDAALRLATLRRRIRCLCAIEECLYDLAREALPRDSLLSPVSEAVLESVAAIVEAAAVSARSGAVGDRQTLLVMTAIPGPAHERVHVRLAEITTGLTNDERARALQFAVRFERLVRLVNEEARLAAESEEDLRHAIPSARRRRRTSDA